MTSLDTSDAFLKICWILFLKMSNIVLCINNIAIKKFFYIKENILTYFYEKRVFLYTGIYIIQPILKKKYLPLLL